MIDERPYLKLSGCTKISPVVTVTPKGGKRAQLKNSFGLPAGVSCPGMTEFCSSVCYAGKLEKLRPAVRNVLQDNYDALKDAHLPRTYMLLKDLMLDFRSEVRQVSRRYNLDSDSLMKFRIHWDGDFFSEDYARAWAYIIDSNRDIQFWAYTRSFDGKENKILHNLLHLPGDNLSLWLSVDKNNVEEAAATSKEFDEVRLAFLSETFEDSVVLKGAVEVSGMRAQRLGAKCPAETGRIAAVSDKGEGACIACNLCVDRTATNNVRFSTTRK